MTERTTFGSKLGLILASAGSAVGLGNIWRFPTETGENGGSAFILLYFLCVVLFGLPVMISEFMIGRSARASVGRAYGLLAPGSRLWKWFGPFQVLIPFLILCYYNVVAGWTLYYFYEALIGTLGTTPDDRFSTLFTSFTADPFAPVLCLLLFMGMTHYVVAQGVSKGIERFSKIMMPGLFLLLLILVGCSLTMPGTSQALHFLFTPDFSKITASTVLSAMGQAFFSLSIGMGILTTYASYFREDTDLGKSALTIAGFDTGVSVLAGLVIFPAVFSAGTQPDEGPSLIFIALPGIFRHAFGELTWLSYIFSLFFYALLILATLTSTISIHEAVTSYLSEATRWSRRKAATLISVLCSLLGIFCVLSFGLLKEYTLGGMTVFDLFDYVTAKWMLPVSGFFIAVFAGRRLSKRVWWTQMTNAGTRKFPFFPLFIFAIRWVCPLGILLIFLNELGIIETIVKRLT